MFIIEGVRKEIISHSVAKAKLDLLIGLSYNSRAEGGENAINSRTYKQRVFITKCQH